MKRVASLDNGNLLVEMSPDEWQAIINGEKPSNGVPADLGSKIVAWREWHGMTQQELANCVEISRNYLSQIERGVAVNVSHRIWQQFKRHGVLS